MAGAWRWRAQAMQERMARVVSSSRLFRARRIIVMPCSYPRPPGGGIKRLDSELHKWWMHSQTSIFWNDFTTMSSNAKRHGFLTSKFAGGVRGLASGNLPPHEIVTMPALSPTMTQGNVGKWKKQVGDEVAAGEVLCDIETDKATLDLECMEDGILAKILTPAGTKDVLVGKLLCIIAESKEGLENFASYKADGASSGGGQAAPSAPPPPKQQAPPSPFPSPAPFQASAAPPSNLPPHQVLTMPALSPTMTQGNVRNWKKKEGDKVAAGDVICDIETDKATLDFETLEDGVFVKILMPSGSKDVPVGKALCVIAESEEDMDKFANYSGGGGGGGQRAPQASPLKQQAATAPTSALPPPRAPPADLPPHQILEMPALSPTMTLGNVGRWMKKEGDQIAAGDVLCDIETDKATLDFESLEDGYLAKIIIPSGSKDVKVGMKLCIIAESAENLGKFASYSGASAPAAAAPVAQALASQPSSKAPPRSPAPASRSGSVAKGKSGPAVKKLLAESGLNASQIQGTGPRGMVVKGDVLAAMKGGMKPQAGGTVRSAGGLKGDKSKAAVPDAPLSFEDIPNTPICKIIAKRLLESKNCTPHCYLQLDTFLDATLRFRKELKDKHGISVSVNDFVIKAAALALKEVPEANAFWDDKAGDRKNNETVDISIAVATEKGLVTPIVKNADQKSLSTISAEVTSLAGKARDGKLKPHEFQGGTFSISNLGMFQVDHFCAIINPPQACILAVGRGVRKVVWDEDNDGPKTVTEMLVTISVDHRVYDGDTTGRFLAAFKKNLSNPQRMLL